MNSTLKWIERNYGPPMKVFSSITRGMIIPSPGYELFCADFSSIEARLAFWVAEHEMGLQAFRNNEKLYEMMAAEIFDMEVCDVLKDSLERFIGKESILACQYGQGWPKFKSGCHNKGMKQITDEIAQKAVYTYRKVHHPIPTLWRKLEEAAIKAISNPGESYYTNKVKLHTRGDWLNIKLPSDRELRYYKPIVKQKQLASGRLVPEVRYMGMEFHQWRQVSIWGGIFTNHVVQGIARDLMVNGIQNIDRAGYRFLLSVHDEGLSEHKKGLGNLNEYIGLMTTLPKWAKGAPISAEGWCGPRYKK